MPRYTAFLRAINVGDRRVTNDDLAQLFVDIGCNDVATYLASGNVIFDAGDTGSDLEPQIEAHLRERLGYDIPTFLRKLPELERLTASLPTNLPSSDAQTKTYVVFAKTELQADHRSTLDDLANDVDRFVTDGRHIIWERILDAGESNDDRGPGIGTEPDAYPPHRPNRRPYRHQIRMRTWDR